MSTFSAATVGFAYGLVIAVLSFVIAGGGHGWNSSLISAVSLILLPFVAVAWIRRHRALAVAAIVFGGLVDVALVVATTREGFKYVERTFATIPLEVLGWAALWFFWQIALMIGLLRGTFLPRSNI